MSRRLRGPFTRLIDKLALRARKLVVRRGGPPRASRGPTGQGLGRRESRLLAAATHARDAELLRLTRAPAHARPATVVGAYDVKSGRVAVGQSSKLVPECAEGNAVRKLGGRVGDVRFTGAKRPISSGPPFRDIAVCAAYCEPAYGRQAFPDPATLFESDMT